MVQFIKPNQFFFVDAIFTAVICQLAITEIIIPTYVKFGTTAVLLCQYDLDGDSLYSVKWYKGSHGKGFIIQRRVPMKYVKI